MVDFDRKVTVVHFNVGSGYMTYLEEDAPDRAPRVKNIVLERSEE